MDIQRKPRPWFVRHRYPLLAGTVFAAVVVYVMVLALRPHRLTIDGATHRIAEVAVQPFMEYVDVEGLVLPIRTVQVHAPESGFADRIVAEEGAMLDAGDTILVLSNPELLRTIDDEQVAWQNSERNFRDQEIEMQQKTITLRQQVLDAEHQMAALDKSLRQSREEYRMGIKSKAELEVAEEDYRYQHQRLLLQMQSLSHDSAATRLKREMIQANRDAAARRLSRTTDRTANLVVRSPVAGQLSFLNVTQGQQVAAGASIGEIKVLTEYKVRASLSEYYIDRVTTGLPARIAQQDLTFPLRISRVVSEVKDRQFACDLLFTADKPSNLRLGKSFRVQIELGKPEKALVIPQGDFYRHTAGRWIYRLAPDGRTARRTPIEIGRQNPKQYEVVAGLQPGDRVIVSGYDKLGDAEELVISMD